MKTKQNIPFRKKGSALVVRIPPELETPLRTLQEVFSDEKASTTARKVLRRGLTEMLRERELQAR